MEKWSEIVEIKALVEKGKNLDNLYCGPNFYL